MTTIGDELASLSRTRQIIRCTVGDLDVSLCTDEREAVRERCEGRASIGPVWIAALANIKRILGGRCERVSLLP